MPEQEPKKGLVRLKIVCPLFEVVNMDVEKILLPGAEGDILILPDRAPIFVLLKAGRLIAYPENAEPISFLISRGISEVRRNLCPVLAWGGQEDKIDIQDIRQKLEKEEKRLSDSERPLSHTERIDRIDFFKMILRELENKS